MARYGVNYYGLAKYGSETTVSYAATGFSATSTDYGTIKLKWNSPIGKWSKIKLVRNSYGFPVDYLDGEQLDIKANGNLFAYQETDPTTFVDSGLATNAFYYYSLFVFERVNFTWKRVGDILGLAVNDYGYTDTLYNYLPEVYKISTTNEVVGSSGNDTLYSFLSLFGFQLSQYHTYTNLLVNRYDTSKLNGKLLPSLLQELAIAYEPEIGYQQSRILARDAGELYKAKGSADGLREFLKAFTGWAIPSATTTTPLSPVEGIQIGHNLMLDYNDSSFEESVGHWLSDGTSALSCLKQKTITNYSMGSNIIVLTLGAGHGYKVGNKITISGSDVPILNTNTGVSITAVTSTTITFAYSGAPTIATTRAWNYNTNAYPTVMPYPAPYNEPTALSTYPNRQKGILAVTNSSVTAGTIKALCGNTGLAVTKGIPVTAGLSYVFSIYTTNSTTTRNVSAGIKWCDRFGAAIGSDAFGTALASGTATSFTVRPYVVSTAPTGAYYAVPIISIAAAAGSASNEFQYFDCAQFEQAAAMTSFDDARQLHVTFRANRINELKNPSFALISGTNASPVITPWSVTNAAKTIDPAQVIPGNNIWLTAYKTLTGTTARVETVYTHDFKVGDVVNIQYLGSPFDGVQTITAVGEKSNTNNAYIEFTTTTGTLTRTADVDGEVWLSGNALKLVASATGTVNVKSWDGSTASQQMPIYYPGTSYTFSVHADRDQYAGFGNEASVTAYTTWYDVSHNLLSTNNGTTTSVNGYEENWTRVSVTATAPSTAAYAIVGINWVTTINHILYLDNALFEQAPLVYDYFDGSSGFGDTTNYTWEGLTPNAARSHYYKNRYAITNRAGNSTFIDQLPLGSTIALYLAQPQT